MDKLTRALNKPDKSLSALRIVAAKPQEDVGRLPYSLVVLDDLDNTTSNTCPDLHPSQQKMVDFISSFKARNKILYIGSRIDNFRKDEKRRYLPKGACNP